MKSRVVFFRLKHHACIIKQSDYDSQVPIAEAGFVCEQANLFSHDQPVCFSKLPLRYYWQVDISMNDYCSSWRRLCE